jgi:hypothetical protein
LLDCRIPLREGEAHDHVLRLQDYRQAGLELRAKVQRGQGPFANDDRVHELDGDVLGVGRGRAIAESQEPPSSEEPAGHLVASLGQSGGLSLKEGFEDGVTPEQFFAATGGEDVRVDRHPSCLAQLSDASRSHRTSAGVSISASG